MKFGVVVFPGSNCDDDMVHVLKNVMGLKVEKLWHKETELKGFTTNDCIVLPGGFSYGDYVRAGAIAQFSPIMKKVVEHANSGGFVFGICNGFQVLCEAELLPGALLRNSNQRFVCKNVFLKTESTKSPLTKNLNRGQVLKVPIAHADGRYHADAQTLEQLERNDQILFTYCNESGENDEDSNPNGSSKNIAGICNANRNVFGMMPHPERCAEPILGNDDGKILFESLLSSFEALIV